MYKRKDIRKVNDTVLAALVKQKSTRDEAWIEVKRRYGDIAGRMVSSFSSNPYVRDNRDDIESNINLALFRSLARGNFRAGEEMYGYFSGIARHEITSAIKSSLAKKRDVRKTEYMAVDEKGRQAQFLEKSVPESHLNDHLSKLKVLLTDYEAAILDCWVSIALSEPSNSICFYEKIAKMLKVPLKSVDNAVVRIRDKAREIDLEF